MSKRLPKDLACRISWCPCHRDITLSSTTAALQIRCPLCKAHQRHYCRTASGIKRKEGVHRARIHRRFMTAGATEAGIPPAPPEVKGPAFPPQVDAPKEPTP